VLAGSLRLPTEWTAPLVEDDVALHKNPPQIRPPERDTLKSLVPPHTRRGVSLSHVGQGEILVPPYTYGSVSLTGGRVKA
jgi:hypothetical protein